MILDSKGEFSDAQDLTNTATAAVVNSTNHVDLGSAAPGDIGTGEPFNLIITVPVAFTSGGAPEIFFRLVSDATTTIATNGDETRHMEIGPFLKADLAANRDPIVVRVQSGGKAFERYLGVQIEHTTAALTAGSINAFIAKDDVYWTPYPDAIS